MEADPVGHRLFLVGQEWLWISTLVVPLIGAGLLHTQVHHSSCRMQCEWHPLELCSEAALARTPLIALGKSFDLSCLSTPFDGWSLDSPGEPVDLPTCGSIPWRFPFSGSANDPGSHIYKSHPTLTFRASTRSGKWRPKVLPDITSLTSCKLTAVVGLRCLD